MRKSILIAASLITLAIMISQIRTIYSAALSIQKKGRVAGVVLDLNDARVTGAAVTFKYGNDEWLVKSGAIGEFEIELPVNDDPYHFTVKAGGFCTFNGELLRVRPETTEMINIHLEVLTTHAQCRCSSNK
jgi:heme A synthase